MYAFVRIAQDAMSSLAALTGKILGLAPGKPTALLASLLAHGLMLALMAAMGPFSTAGQPLPQVILYATEASPAEDQADHDPTASPASDFQAAEVPVPVVAGKSHQETGRSKANKVQTKKPQPLPLEAAPASMAGGQELAANSPGLETSDPGPREPDRQAHPGGGQPGGHADETRAYYGTIISRLEQVKRYPEEARERGGQGTVLVRFVLGRGGELMSWQIEKGSGLESLDQEVGNMLRQAAPFPPFPQAIELDRLVLVVPVSFTLKQG